MTKIALLLSQWLLCGVALAGTDATITGQVLDKDGIAVPNAAVSLLSPDGKAVLQATASPTGEYRFFPVTFGDYQVQSDVPGVGNFTSVIHVDSGSTVQVDVHLTPIKEMVVNVKAKKYNLQKTSVSSTEVSHEQIDQMPQGSEISLPKLLTSTTPGAVSGPFGQMFFRGNHANIQYQIDGVQLPDSPSGTFGEAFSPRNIDHMEVITGGVSAEYGDRLAAVANIVTKSGPEVPGGDVELNYGSYNTFSPHLTYGGSNETGSVHYFFSANYHTTDRGLDTPQPKSSGDQTQGGTDAVHDHADGQNEFAKIDWLIDNSDKLSLILFNAENHFEIPNYPSSFSPSDPMFQNGYVDHWGNTNGPGQPSPFIYTPSYTNDYQDEANAYAEVVWKHTISDHAFLQLAPYYKYSFIHFQNDPANDLFSGSSAAGSFYENRNISNVGMKGDYTWRWRDDNVLKAGFQVQDSQATGTVSVQTSLSAPPSFDNNMDTGYTEGLYVQDDWTIDKRWTLNAGLRFDATQFDFAGTSPTDSMVQPRIGLSYLITDTTKLHVFYGKLFQPAPVEDLRDTFINSGQGTLAPYDIKAEKDDYYEFGVTQQLAERQVAALNVYYKDAKNMLDDTSLLNTAIAQPYNFAKGYAYGAELSLKGEFSDHWSDFLNYSYEIAKGQGISGGIFAFPSGTPTDTDWTFLDHVQVQTANAGATYSTGKFWWTGQGLYGSGLRTGPDNGTSLPPHFTFDTSVGYQFHGEDWWSRCKVSADILNILDNVYPVTVANGFNASHYAAGREFFIRYSKEL